jgi:signal recognition particle GTPase
VTKIITEIRDRWRLGKIRNQDEAGQIFRNELVTGWGGPETRELKFAASGPTVVMVAGVNGAGKTTSIAKLAWLLKNEMKEGHGLRLHTSARRPSIN